MSRPQPTDSADLAIPEELAHVTETLWSHVWEVEPPTPTSPDNETAEWFASAVEYSESRINVLTDVRSLLTAYARELSDPRPSMKTLAAAQGISSTSLRRRYTDAQVNAIRLLLAKNAPIDHIIEPFPTLHDEHLRHIDEVDSFDEEIERRNKLARLYAMHECKLASHIGIELPDSPYIRDVANGKRIPAPSFSNRSAFKVGQLYPGRRRRLLKDYNPRIMEDALAHADSDLQKSWRDWTAQP